MKVTEYNPKVEIPDLSGKVFFITGGTTGIGKEAILELVQHNPSAIYFTGRNSERAQQVISTARQSCPSVKVEFISMDANSLKSVKQASEKFLSLSKRLDVFIGNAGIMALPPSITIDGYEQQFAVNHLSHALLIKNFLPLLQASQDPRIVTLSSLAFLFVPAGSFDFNTLGDTLEGHLGDQARWVNYARSKLANLLYSKELAKHYPEILCVSLQPGVVKTELATGLGDKDQEFIDSAVNDYGGWLEPVQGAYNTLWASTSNRNKLENGGFYEPVAEKGRTSENADDDELASKLYEWTQKELKEFFLN